jgi:hypothetical protein
VVLDLDLPLTSFYFLDYQISKFELIFDLSFFLRQSNLHSRMNLLGQPTQQLCLVAAGIRSYLFRLHMNSVLKNLPNDFAQAQLSQPDSYQSKAQLSRELNLIHHCCNKQ